MESVKLEYDTVFNELCEVWLERVKSKKYTFEAYEFERNAGVRLHALTKDIVNGTWAPKGYKDFKVYHPNRIISAPYYEDRIVEQWLTDKFVKPYVKDSLIEENMACQEGKGPQKAMIMLENNLKKLYAQFGTSFWFLQCDAKGYYDNINHEVVKKIFSGMDKTGRGLFFNILDTWESFDGYAKKADLQGHYGVPKGNLPSQWIGVTYLSELDHLFKERQDCLFYIRYMDDFLLFFKCKEDAKRCNRWIETYLEENKMGIRLHEKKTNYAPINRTITFCGWNYRLSEDGKLTKHVRQDRKRLTKKKFKYMQNAYYVGEMSWKDVSQSVQGTFAYYKCGDTKNLRRYLSNRFRFTHDPDTFYSGKYKKLILS